MPLTRVQGSLIAGNTISTSSIANSSITSDKIAANAVITAGIADGNVTLLKGGTGATTAAVARDNLGVGPSNTVTFSNVTVTGNVTLTKVIETVVNLGNTGASAAIDLNRGTVFLANLTANCTFTLSNAVGTSAFTLVLRNAFPGNAIVWSGGTFLFPGGSANLGRTTTVNNTDVWTFFTPNAGTTWYGAIPMKEVS